MSRFFPARKNTVGAIDVSRYGKAPWNRLSPFHLFDQVIPVPGTYGYSDFEEMEFFNELSRSVEGIWQGLKSINGVVDKSMFAKQARKRRGVPNGHQYGYRLLNYRQSKALIYIPSYLHVLTKLESDLVEQLRALPGEVGLVDVSYQPDCLGPKPISHAALLADYLNGKLEPYLQADARLHDLSRRMTARHGSEPPTSGPGNLKHYSWVDPEYLEIKQRVLDLKDVQPEDYSSCAAIFEREAMMMTAVRYAGCYLEYERITELLDAWVRAELLTLDEANQLSSWAPIGRFNEDWFQGSKS
jgi:hypothetical protein